MDIEIVKSVLDQLVFVRLAGDIREGEQGQLIVPIIVSASNSEDLKWIMVLDQIYPKRYGDSESIHFINTNCISYPHVMKGGVLCLHTLHNYDGQEKLKNDLFQLKDWVEKYYIRKEKDEHYEHLVVPTNVIGEYHYYFLFADTMYPFQKDEFGTFSYGVQLDGLDREAKTRTICVYSFQSITGAIKEKNQCGWSPNNNFEPEHTGLFCTLPQAPADYGKFIIEQFSQLNFLLSQKQLDFIYREITIRGNKYAVWDRIPLMLGYNLPDGRMHWQTILLSKGNLPTEPLHIVNESTGKKEWHSVFSEDVPIEWAQSRNVSYDYFFGRGLLPSSITDKKVLLLGLGAIGSQIAQVLVRGGLKSLSIYDIDVKTPGNICRSEYFFASGFLSKSIELKRILGCISPFVNCMDLHDVNLDNQIKNCINDPNKKKEVEEFFNFYDLVIDCTTDNDMMHCLDQLQLKADIINLSITNKAKEFVCVFSPNIVETVEFLYNNVFDSVSPDLYFPSGCWNPTFKASYNDIACLVQVAVKYIVRMLNGEIQKQTFYLCEESDGIKIHKV